MDEDGAVRELALDLVLHDTDRLTRYIKKVNFFTTTIVLYIAI